LNGYDTNTSEGEMGTLYRRILPGVEFQEEQLMIICKERRWYIDTMDIGFSLESSSLTTFAYVKVCLQVMEGRISYNVTRFRFRQ